MSLFDSIARVVSDRVRRLMLLADAAMRLGPGWIGFRIRYKAERRLGLIERRSKQHPWPDLGEPLSGLPSIIDVDTLSSWLRDHCDDERRQALIERVEALRGRRFDVFGVLVEPVDWHHDPYSGVHYPNRVHWSRVDEFADADIKRVWEPSRFAWAFDLVRAHVVAPEAGAAELFWELLEEWCEQNPPNSGVNWACGQEASIRLMAVVAAGSALRQSASDAQVATIERLAWATAERVEANIAYARSQRNNHHASEAVGLLTASLLFPRHHRARTWRRLGERHGQEVCEKLIFQDGGSSQYSMNYHRVFVHNLVWATQCYRTTGDAVPLWLLDALDRSSRFLMAMVEPISGSGPFFGPDDGARILPLSEHSHRSLAPDAMLAQSCAAMRSQGDAASDPSCEPCAWFGLKEGSIIIDRKKPLGSAWVNSFPEMGIHVLGADAIRAYVICRDFRFRPGQDDMLHCDVWIDGINVAFDSGTQSYHPRPGEAGPLDSGSAHNGPRFPDQALMERPSRFLWARWPSTRSEVSCEPHVARGSFMTTGPQKVLRRDVRVTGKDVTVVDSSDTASPLEAFWRLCPEGIEVETEAQSTLEALRQFSGAYGSSSNTWGFAMSTDNALARPVSLQIRRRAPAVAAHRLVSSDPADVSPPCSSV